MKQEWIPVFALAVVGGAIGAFMAHNESLRVIAECVLIGSSSAVTMYAVVRVLP